MREDRGRSGDGQRIEQLAWMLFLKIMDDKEQEQEMLHDDYVSPVPTEYQWRNWAANSEGITGEELQQFIDPVYSFGAAVPGAAGLACARPPLVHGAGGVRGQQQVYEERHQPAQGGEQAERD